MAASLLGAAYRAPGPPPPPRPPGAKKAAIEDWGPGWVQDSERVEASLRGLRQAVLDMHRVVKKRRYDSARAVPAERRIVDL